MIALLALLIQSPDSLPPKPTPPPAEWRSLIGGYLSGNDTIYVYEDHGALFARVDSVSPPVRSRADRTRRSHGGHASRSALLPVASCGSRLSARSPSCSPRIGC